MHDPRVPEFVIVNAARQAAHFARAALALHAKPRPRPRAAVPPSSWPGPFTVSSSVAGQP